MKVNKPTDEKEVKSSVNEIYNKLLEERNAKREAKLEEKRLKREQEEELSNDEKKKIKKEKRKKEFSEWEDVYRGLTGEDWDVPEPKKSKYKIKKWIDVENDIVIDKPKKKKKKDYNKIFDPELNLLKSGVADQNRFTKELMAKFNTLNKEGQFNKTIVELAGAINSSRLNALSYLRETGNIKKAIADLTMKQKKLDAETKGNFDEVEGNIALEGSRVFDLMYGDNSSNNYNYNQTNTVAEVANTSDGYIRDITIEQQVPQNTRISNNFNPDNWDGPDLSDNMVIYENIPHEIICVLDKENNRAKFKAVRTDTGEELTNYPVPQVNINKLSFNTKDMVVKSEFDDIYKLEII